MQADKGISRRQFLAMTGSAAVGLALGGCRGKSGSEAKPNIVFLMCDQLHVRAISAYGGKHIKTPNIDRLAAEGILCENAYCAYPVCSPSRASVATGLYPHSHKVIRNVDTLEEPAITNESVITEGVLAQGGYATWHFGRWHIGKREWLDCYEGRLEKNLTDDYWDNVLPAEIEKLRGDGHPVIDLADVGQYAQIPDLKKGVEKWQHTVVMTDAMWAAHKRWQSSVKAKYPILSLVGRSIVPAEHHEEALLADQAIEVIKNAKKGEPFMLTWSVIPPHDPAVTMEPYYSLIPRTENILPDNANSLPESMGDTSQDFVEIIGREAELEYIAVYLGMVKYVDDQVGRILDAIDKAGLTNDTLVLFTADHGDTMGAHGMLVKSTRCMYDETTRVPLIMRYPRHLPAGQRVKAPLSLIDLMPTLLDYAGQEVPVPIDGASLRVLLEGKSDQTSHPVVVENWAGRMVREANWKYAWYDTGVEWLFNLDTDPGETKNLVNDAKYATQVARMRELLAFEMSRTGDPLLAQIQESWADKAG